MTKDFEEWGTKTLGLAAAVKALGAKFIRADKTNPRSIVFYFQSPEDKTGLDSFFDHPLQFDFDEVERLYINDELYIRSAKKYYEALADLKTIIHSR